MTDLPGLHNLLIASARHGTKLDEVSDRLHAFARDARPQRIDRWLILRTTLPLSEPEPAWVARTGLFLVEGQREVAATEEQARRFVETATRKPQNLSALPGDFGGAVIAERTAIILRSAGGRVPFYVYRDDELVVASSLLTWLIRAIGHVPPLDLTTAAALSGGWGIFPGSHTFFRDIIQLRRGHLARLDGPGRVDTIEIKKYWDPRPQTVSAPTSSQREEHQEELRRLLLSYLDRELSPGEGNLLTLSGGVDSSSLAALSAGVLMRQVAALTFAPPVEPQRSEEARYVANIAVLMNLKPRWTFPLGWETRLELLLDAPPVVFTVAHPALGALPRLFNEYRPTVLFGGEFADETCGSVFTIPDWMRDTPLTQLLRAPRSIPQGRRSGSKRWLKQRRFGETKHMFLPWARDLPSWLSEEVQSCWNAHNSEVIGAELEDGRPWRYLDLHTRADGFMAMNWEVASALGVRRAWPFIHREVLELTYSCHPSELAGPGIKKLLRGALRDDVPEMNLLRETRGHSESPPTDVPLPASIPPEIIGIFSERFLEDPRSEDPWAHLYLWLLTLLVENARTVAKGAIRR